MIRRVAACTLALALATKGACAFADDPAHADSPRVLVVFGPDAQEVLLEALGQAARARRDDVVLREVEALTKSPLARWSGKRAGRRGKSAD